MSETPAAKHGPARPKSGKAALRAAGMIFQKGMAITRPSPQAKAVASALSNANSKTNVFRKA